MPNKIGVMVCGHGSRSNAAVEEFAAMVKQLPDHFTDWPVEFGYLEFANPVIRDGLDSLREQGATTFWQCQVCCLPPCMPKMIFRRC